MTRRKENIVKRLEFPHGDFYRALADKRLKLLRALRKLGDVTISDLAKHLQRHRSGISKDLKTLCSTGFVERTESGEHFVPWDKLHADITLNRPIEVTLVKFHSEDGRHRESWTI